MEPESELCVDIMSKTDVLRVIVAEKLTTAAQEIMAVVERTVAGYEQEASVFREEIDRQKRQLERLLEIASPVAEIKSEPVDDELMIPVSEPLHDGSEHDQEELVQQYELEDGSRCVLMAPEEHYEDEPASPFSLPPPDDPEPLPRLDYSRAFTSTIPKVRYKKRVIPKERKYRKTLIPDPLPLRIRLLDDPGIKVINRNVYKKYPLKTMTCPVHLKEKDFLAKLRSMFPRLPKNKSFDLFMCGRKRNMFPVTVKSMTPLEVWKKINGGSALFIRLRREAAPEPQGNVELGIRVLKDTSATLNEDCPIHRLQCPRRLQESGFLDLLRSTFPELADSETVALFTTDKTKKLSPLNVKSLTPVEIDKKIDRGGDEGRLCLYVLPKRLEDIQSGDKDPPSDVRPTPLKRGSSRGRPKPIAVSVELKLWILEDSSINHMSTKLFQTIIQHKLRCPLGLQETEFLDLLRCTYPQLGSERSFDFFLSDRTKKLFPLEVDTLTPENIQTAIKSFGSGFSALYIRLNNVSIGELSSNAEQTLGAGGQQNTASHVVLNVCFLQAQVNVVSASVLKKNPVLELICPSGLTEMDFLKLLRSTFPVLAGKPFDVLTSDQSGRLHPLRVEMMTPEEIHQILEFSPNSNIFIQLRGPHKSPASAQELGVADDFPSTSGQTGPSISHFQAGGGSVPGDGDDQQMAGLSWTEPLLVFESDNEDGDGEEEGDGGEEGDGEEEGDKEEEEAEWTIDRSSKKTIKGRVRSGVRASRKSVRSNGVPAAPLCCSVCSVPRSTMSLLLKHCWSHVEEPAMLCGVCGERSETTEELRGHLQSHLKTHSCDFCGKSFLSITGLKGHIARHKGERPYECTVCHKAFAEPWVLNNHMTVHSPDKPHKCDICQKPCSSKMKLKLHQATHTDERPFQCNVCPSAYRSLGTLSQHMLRHLGRTSPRERSHACRVCDKAFSMAWKLQAHMKSHKWEQGAGKRGGKSKLLLVT